MNFVFWQIFELENPDPRWQQKDSHHDPRRTRGSSLSLPGESPQALRQQQQQQAPVQQAFLLPLEQQLLFHRSEQVSVDLGNQVSLPQEAQVPPAATAEAAAQTAAVCGGGARGETAWAADRHLVCVLLHLGQRGWPTGWGIIRELHYGKGWVIVIEDIAHSHRTVMFYISAYSASFRSLIYLAYPAITYKWHTVYRRLLHSLCHQTLFKQASQRQRDEH